MIRNVEIEKTSVEDIVVPDRRRQPTDRHVEEMRKSLRENGLLTPIGVRLAYNMVVNGQEWENIYVLVYGATRLAAAKLEGWEEIDVQVIEGSDLDFQKAEIIENLHRAELTVQQRAEWTAALVALCVAETAPQPKPADAGPLFAAAPPEKPGQLGHVSAGGRGNSGGVAEAARELGTPRTTVRRDLKIAAIAPAAKEAARAARLDDNQ